MNCRIVRKWLPLYGQSELDDEKRTAVEKHLETCEACRREWEAYLFSSAKIKEWLSGDVLEWGEPEWTNTVRAAVRSSGQGRPRSSGLAPWPFKAVWAWAAMAATALILAAGVSRPSFLTRLAGFTSPKVAEFRSRPLWEGEKQAEQNILSLTMVSQETGLKIVWFLNKKFNLEENK